MAISGKTNWEEILGKLNPQASVSAIEAGGSRPTFLFEKGRIVRQRPLDACAELIDDAVTKASAYT
jgi:hypothetical protein